MRDPPQSIKRRLLIFGMNLFIVVVYLSVCAVIMRALERPTEDAKIDEGNVEVKYLKESLNLTDDHLEKLEHSGLCDFHQAPNWTMTGALFFTLTVITTIGYGSFAPATQNGRSFTVAFGLIGIGVVGQMLASCASLLRSVVIAALGRRTHRIPEMSARERHMSWVTMWERLCDEEHKIAPEALIPILEHLTGDVADPGIVEHIATQVDPDGTGCLCPASVVRAVSIWHQVEAELPRRVTFREGALTISAAAGWILIWATGFHFIEGWSYREGLWFCFVSMSTIGFGDYVPATHLGRLMSFIFIVPGLGMGAAALGMLWDVFNARRYWMLQRKFQDGSVGSKWLEAHGITQHINDPRRRAVRQARAAITARRMSPAGGATAAIAGIINLDPPPSPRPGGGGMLRGGSLNPGTGAEKGGNDLQSPLLAEKTELKEMNELAVREGSRSPRGGMPARLGTEMAHFSSGIPKTASRDSWQPVPSPRVGGLATNSSVHLNPGARDGLSGSFIPSGSLLSDSRGTRPYVPGTTPVS
eukprot:Hpha_TRINITY_DN10126_c0_g2::TRINITY_DN10126_c0_g2_i1::g.131568::m.131568